MMLISTNDELGELYSKKVGALKEWADEEEMMDRAPALGVDNLFEESGVKTAYYDANRRDFYEMGVEDAIRAAQLGTNLVLTWDEKSECLVTIFADSEKQAEKKILQLRRKLLKFKKAVQAAK